MDLISCADYARRRGVSPQAVSKAIRAGRLRASVRMVDGQPKIAPEIADAEWQRNTRERVDRAPVASNGGQETGGDAATSSPIADYHAARARHEAARAALAELELAEREGKLVLVADVEAELVRVFTECKTKLLGIPTRIKQRLPHIANEDIRLIDDLVREALEALADGRDPWSTP